ncbi:MAG: extracellular solute-binding protein [Clostridiales bacterium]|nr:extracellular solute-binding protein [Clostridiales bacterium]
MKVWIRTAAALLAAALCVPAASCGKKETKGGESVYSASLIYENRDGWISFAGWAGGRIIIADRAMDENKYWHDVLVSVSEDGGDVRTIVLKNHMREGDSASSGINLCYIDGDENIWYSEMVFAYPDDGSPADLRCYLCELTPEGEPLKEYDISEIYAGSSSYALTGIAVRGDEIYVSDSMSIYRVSNAGIEIAVKSETGGINRLLCARDGNLYAVLHGNTICPVDLGARKLLEGFKIPGSDEYRAFTVKAGDDRDFIYSTQLGIKGFDVGDESAEMIVDFTAADFAEGDINSNYGSSGDGRYIAVPRNLESKTFTSVYLLTPKASNGKEKTTLTLGCIYITQGVRSAAAKFNRSNGDFRIEIADYGENVSEPEAITALNADIVSGSCPDMLLLNSMMPYESYINKGLLTDLYSLGDLGAFIRSDELQQNIIKTCERGEKLYSVPGSFALMTMAAASQDIISALGKIPDSFTVDDLIAIAGTDSGRAPFADISREDFMIFLAYFAFSQYADAENGVCDFESEDFVKLLDFAASIPEQSPAQKSGLSAYEVLKDDKAIMGFTQIDSYNQYWRDRMTSFDGDIVLMGFPGRKGGPTMPFVVISELAVCSTAKDIGGCADFVRFFLSEDVQSTSSEIPVNKKARAKLAESSMSDASMAGVYYVGGMGVNAGNITEEAVAELDEAIDRLDMYIRVDETSGGLIIEEVSAFLAGARSAGECASLIQNRVQNMLNERG